MLYFMMATGFQYIVETDEVALNIGIGVGNAITHTGLGCEVHHYSDIMRCKYFIYGCLVGNRCVNECPITIQCFDFFQTFVFDIDIIIVGNGVYTYYFNVLHIMEKTLYQVAADKACCTGYQYSFSFKIYVVCYHALVSSKNVTRVNFLFGIFQAIVKAIGYDGFALCFEFS